MRVIVGPSLTENGEKRLQTNKEIKNETGGETIKS